MNFVCHDNSWLVAMCVIALWWLAVESANYLSGGETQLGWRIFYGLALAGSAIGQLNKCN